MKSPEIIEYIKKTDNELAKSIQPHLYGKVLKLGNGIGYLTEALSQNLDITVVDVALSEGVINKEQVVLYDGLHLPFEDNSFDCTVCVFVLHHTPDPLVVLREMKRVSKRLVIVEETYDSLFSKLDLVYRDIYVNLFAGQSSKIHWGSYFSTISIKDTFEELDLQVFHSNTKPHRNYYKETYVVEQK